MEAAIAARMVIVKDKRLHVYMKAWMIFIYKFSSYIASYS